MGITVDDIFRKVVEYVFKSKEFVRECTDLIIEKLREMKVIGD